MQPGGDARGSGLAASLRNLLATAVSAVHTRLELVATEAEEQGVRLARLWVLSACALILLALAVLFGSVLVLVVFWDEHRVAAAAALALAYLAGAVAVGLRLRRAVREHPRPFAGTIAELAKDRDALKGRP